MIILFRSTSLLVLLLSVMNWILMLRWRFMILQWEGKTPLLLPNLVAKWFLTMKKQSELCCVKPSSLCLTVVLTCIMDWCGQTGENTWRIWLLLVTHFPNMLSWWLLSKIRILLMQFTHFFHISRKHQFLWICVVMVWHPFPMYSIRSMICPFIGLTLLDMSVQRRRICGSIVLRKWWWERSWILDTMKRLTSTLKSWRIMRIMRRNWRKFMRK